MKTHYDSLEVSEAASQEVIRGAYMHLSKKWHPDKHRDAVETANARMKEINAAYDILSVPGERSRYDDELRRQRESARHTDSGARQAEPVRPAYENKPPSILNTLRWIAFFPAGLFAGVFLFGLYLALGGWLFGGWAIPSAMALFAVGCSQPVGSVMAGLKIAPQPTPTVKWIMLAPAAILCLLLLLGLLAADKNTVSAYEKFTSLSPKTQYVFIFLGMAFGTILTATRRPEDIVKK